jgi:hypothetical protein
VGTQAVQGKYPGLSSSFGPNMATQQVYNRLSHVSRSYGAGKTSAKKTPKLGKKAITRARPDEQVFSKLFYKSKNIGSRAIELATADGVKVNEMPARAIVYRNRAIREAWSKATPEEKEAVRLVQEEVAENNRRIKEEGLTSEELNKCVTSRSRFLPKLIDSLAMPSAWAPLWPSLWTRSTHSRASVPLFFSLAKIQISLESRCGFRT